MGAPLQTNIFVIDGQQYAIPLTCIIRIIRAVEVTPVPHAPASVLGVVDYHGTILPVMNIRHCLGLKPKEVDVNDRFIIARTSHRTIAFVVDEVTQILLLDDKNSVEANNIVENTDFNKMVRLSSGIVFIYDVEKLISYHDNQLLDKLLDSSINQSLPQ